MTLSASVQSTNPKVLENIKRDNISAEQMIELTKSGEILGANSYGELILSLPGETKESHFKSVFYMIDAEVNVLRIYQLLLLPGSEISSENSRKEYGMNTRFRLIPRCFGKYDYLNKNFSATEIEEVCIANNTLSYQDYLDCRSLTLSVELFYNDMIFKELTTFLKTFEISPSDFMQEVHNIANSDTGEVGKIYKSFIDKDQKSLWRKKSELENFCKKFSDFNQYISDNLAINELFESRAIMYLKYMEELHSIAFSGAKKLLNKNLMLNKENLKYLDELFRFSLLRKKDLLSIGNIFTDNFHYDFLLDSPYKHPLSKSIPITFFHSPEQQEFISKCMNQYGFSIDGFGRLLQRGPISAYYRKTRLE